MTKKYVVLPRIQHNELETLLEMAAEVPFKECISHRRRIGVNRENALSVYSTSKDVAWSHKQNKKIRKSMHPVHVDNSLTIYYLKFPKEEGFLDDMDAWLDTENCGTMVSYALTDGCTIKIDGQEVTLNKGQGVAFKLNVLHSVPKRDFEQLWLCSMVFGDAKAYACKDKKLEV